MADQIQSKGQCLCGAVKMSVSSVNHKVTACHCGMCRKWGGGPLLAVECGTGVEIDGEDKITIFDSSEWAERGFCGSCGTHLFYRLKGSSELAIPSGFFDDETLFELERQIFIDRKPSYYSFANSTHDMTEAEVFEKYAPELE